MGVRVVQQKTGVRRRGGRKEGVRVGWIRVSF